MLAQVVPELALARVVTAGGPYRPGDEISLAFTTPTVSRLVAHDAELRAKCVPIENALIPEMISVQITHAASPYQPGDVLTLSFVDPRVARVYINAEHPGFMARAEPSANPPATSNDTPATLARDYSPIVQRVRAAPETTDRDVSDAPDNESATSSAIDPATSYPSEIEYPGPDGGAAIAYASDAGRAPSQIRAGERMTLQPSAFEYGAPVEGTEPRAGADTVASNGASSAIAVSSERAPADKAASRGVSIRLEWNQDRLRRFVQVVDKLFTIDRLGWYRHSLAMRLLIPDEIACGDTLASVEAMRHLQALRAAAVESLGKPLLAACMPGFSITSEWLESLESSREARAIAGLRDALLPYASEDEPAQSLPADAAYTIGKIGRSQLIAENATSVEAFLPILIATQSHDAALSARLTEYRRLLVELFAQTARAGEPVRLHQMAQPNHSLDDRLWQLVGAAGEAFGGFAQA